MRADFYDVHHTYWPRRLYRGSIERRFRNLPCHKHRMLRSVHERIHTQPPPRKPQRHTMLAHIQKHAERRCTCGKQQL